MTKWYKKILYIKEGEMVKKNQDMDIKKNLKNIKGMDTFFP